MCVRLNARTNFEVGGAKNDQPLFTSGFGFNTERSVCQANAQSELLRLFLASPQDIPTTPVEFAMNSPALAEA